MGGPTGRMQQAIGREGTIAAMSLEWDLSGDPRGGWDALRALDPSGAVVGIGTPLLQAAGVSVPGSKPFSRLQGGGVVMPATQHALWAYVVGDTQGDVFLRAEQLIAALGPPFHIAASTPLMRYRDGRDLLGYRDGTENPKGDAAWDAALIAEGPWSGGSFALVQRYLHARPRFQALPQ